MPQVIITNRDTTLMNSVVNMFPTLSILLCKCHITKGEDGKMDKHGAVVEKIMDA